jgi:voltage-gated potassium channel Kch
MYYFGGPVETANRTPSTWGETVYFSAITALTIGYGDVVPTSTFGRIDVILLGLIGVVFTGLILRPFGASRKRRVARAARTSLVATSDRQSDDHPRSSSPYAGKSRHPNLRPMSATRCGPAIRMSG